MGKKSPSKKSPSKKSNANKWIIGLIMVVLIVSFGGLILKFSHTGPLPTTADLEKKLVLGPGSLPQKITKTNTKIFERNGINNVFALQYVKGKITKPEKATILTDEVCDPDDYGYYHCWNNIKLANGTIIRGLTIHNMMGGVQCFDKGTKAIVTPYKDGYFLLQRL